MLEEYSVAPNDDEALLRWFVHGESFPDPLLMVDVSPLGDHADTTPEYLWYLKDALGSTGALANLAGEIAEGYVYTPYGETTILDEFNRPREVVAQNRLVYEHRGEEPGAEPVSFTTTVSIEPHADGTKLTLRMVFPSTEARDRVIREYGAVDGGVQTVDRLGDHLGGQRAVLTIALPSDRELIMNRRFDAPRPLVWEAMTRPELLQRWMFTPPGWAWGECEMDVRVGGKFRWTWNGPDGRLALSIRGEHREVTPPLKLVHTELMEMGPGAGECGPDGESAEPWELLATIELDGRDGRTHLKMTLLFPNREGRDGALASGMEHGVAAGYDQLDGLLGADGR